jgi:hypothetical protein
MLVSFKNELTFHFMVAIFHDPESSMKRAGGKEAYEPLSPFSGKVS